MCASEWPERSEWQVAAPTWRDRYYIYKSVLPRGVLLELPQSFLDGWVCHMDRPYAAGRHLEEWAEEHDRPQTEHPAITHPADLDSVPAGTFVFVGARAPDGSLEMGAVGVRDAVFAYTGQPPALRESHIAQEHNGLYWYRVRTGGNDGVDDDEASDLKGQVEDWVINTLAHDRVGLVVTSRPDGVHPIDRYVGRFVVYDLKPLSDKQQAQAIATRHTRSRPCQA